MLVSSKNIKSYQLLICIFFSAWSNTLTAQTNLDSLWAQWEDESIADSTRVMALYHYSWNGYLFSKPDSALYLAKLQYDFAKPRNLKRHMADALSMQGIVFHIKSDYDKAIEYHQQSLEISREIKDKGGAGITLNNLGIAYGAQGNYVKALDNYRRSLELEEEVGDSIGIAANLINMGTIFKTHGEYTKAINHYYRGLEIQEDLNDQYGMSSTLNNIGTLYQDLGEYAEAVTHFKKSGAIDSTENNLLGLTTSLNNIGLVYVSMGNSDKDLLL